MISEQLLLNRSDPEWRAVLEDCLLEQGLTLPCYGVLLGMHGNRYGDYHYNWNYNFINVHYDCKEYNKNFYNSVNEGYDE